jgi:TetR/AcrR family transcriptional regulator, cholesterol catabolism regulator
MEGIDRPDKAERRRREIVESAAALFDAKGYYGTNLDEVAAAVGLRKATLYHYFRGKEEILNSIHEDFLGWSLEREEMRRDSDLSPEQHLLESIADMLEIISERPGHIRTFVEHYRELDPEAQKTVAAKRAYYSGLIEQVIIDGMDAGVFRKMDSKMALFALFGACNWAYQWLPQDPGADPRRVAYSLWEILMHGIQAPAEPSVKAPEAA